MSTLLRNSLIFLILFFGPNVMAFAAPPTNKKSLPPQSTNYRQCTDQRLGISFVCNLDWKLQTEDNVLIIIISQTPLVTLTLGKSATSMTTLDQVSLKDLQQGGQYEDGFTRQNIALAGQSAIRVEGFSMVHPEAKSLDYYLIRNSNMYSILFSVSPKERWNDYAELFKQILESISFDAQKK